MKLVLCDRCGNDCTKNYYSVSLVINSIIDEHSKDRAEQLMQFCADCRTEVESVFLSTAVKKNETLAEI